MVLTNDNAESRRLVEQCYKRHKTNVNPIIDWTDAEVWEFIRENKVPYCELYDDGFHRLGCIGCPMARQRGREKEFSRWPKYKASYIHAFEKMIQARERAGKKQLLGYDGKDVFNWWMEYDVLPGQINLFDDFGEEEGDAEG